MDNHQLKPGRNDEKATNGLLILDKPPGISSARAVARIKRLLPRGTKVGHAGTLDPFATGVLILLLGKATRQCENIMSWRKTYQATIKFGATTATDDPDAPEHIREAITPVSRAAVNEAIPQFVGDIVQRPPAYSAVKVRGKRASDHARAGHAVQLTPRTVHVYSIDVLHYDWPLLDVRIECGRGTYVRSIARDLGEVLGVGGHVRALRRTRVGNFDVEQALKLDEVGEELPQGSVISDF